MKTKSIFIAGALLAGMNFFTSCEKEYVSPDPLSASNSQNAKGGGKGPGGGGGGHTETSGSNLSFPVIWSEGATLALRGTMGTVLLNGVYTIIDGYRAYHQRDAGNEWQASNFTPEQEVYVDTIDWGDNLESVDWYTTSKVRTEIVLTEDASIYTSAPTPFTEYAMLYISGLGPDEMWGLKATDATTPVPQTVEGAVSATVYSKHARLTIQKLNVQRDDATLMHIIWDELNRKWVEDAATTVDLVNDPIFNQAVYQASDGAGNFNAEVNIKGKVIYGYNWDGIKQPGDYRLTFSFDPSVTGSTLNTFFNANTTIAASEEEVVIAAEPVGGGEAVLYLDESSNEYLTYIDVRILPRETGGGGGKGGGGNGGKPTR
ncbi:hypothetical protein [Pontibacter populi]|uniref:Uncharacterized protein n=1 Tax=Pontibacter populi TaxID=890055 RepID=A0ABV1RZ04_9BACT